MEMPKYDGVIERWKVRLVIERARRLGFKRHELPDVLQETVLVLLDFQYDASNKGGAAERTAFTTVIDNTLQNMKRAASRYSTHLEGFRQDAAELSPDKIDTRALDVAEAMAGMSQIEKQVCLDLASGLSVHQIAKQTGHSWYTIDRIILGIRDLFEVFGLDVWVDNEG